MASGEDRLDPYRGPLTPGQIAAGMNAAARNARRLLADAQRLIDVGSFASAASLAALAIEEAGKLPILRGLALAKSKRELEAAWRRYRSHREKNRMWLAPDLIANGANRVWDFANLFAKEAEHPRLLDEVKQLGFYTDCYANAHWSEPSVVIDEQLARALVRCASPLMPKREITEVDISLWQEFVGAVWGGPEEQLQSAVLRWHRTMVERGLLDGPTEKMEQFIQRRVWVRRDD